MTYLKKLKIYIYTNYNNGYPRILPIYARAHQAET